MKNKILISLVTVILLVGTFVNCAYARGYSGGGFSGGGRSFSGGSFGGGSRSFSGGSFGSARSYTAPQSRGYTSSRGYTAPNTSGSRSYSSSRGYSNPSVSSSRTTYNTYHVGNGYYAHPYGMYGGYGMYGFYPFYGFYHPMFWMGADWYGYGWYNPYSWYGPIGGNYGFSWPYIVMSIIFFLLFLGLAIWIFNRATRDEWYD